MSLPTHYLATSIAISYCIAQPYHIQHATEDVYTVQDDALILDGRNITFEENSKRMLNNPSCGLGGSDDRIIGGSYVPAGLYPWVSSLQLGWSYHYCGGALISADYVLTAAHCVAWGREVLQTRVRLGGDRYGVMRRVHKIKIHAGYDDQTNDNDIALIKLRKPVRLGEGVRTICLPQEGEEWEQGPAVVAGWGHTKHSGQESNNLQHVTVDMMSREKCRSMYSTKEITDNMICAGTETGGKDACQGDSGGALFLRGQDGRWVMPGIVSWGRGCGDPEHPGVYTSVERFRGWVDRHTRD